MVLNCPIFNKQSCTPDEIEGHIGYLVQENMSAVADAIMNGAPLSKGDIGSRDDLGALVTIFKNLDLVFARQRYGREKFLVREVLPTLRDPNCNDVDSLLKVEQYGMCIIVDGNKRASACYEGRSATNFTLVPVYLVSC
jgi:hypothetical protein